MQYSEPLITADKILELFIEDGQQSIISSHIYKRVGDKSNLHITQALKRLTEVDGHLDFNNSYYTLSGTAQQFISEGKYRGLCEKESNDLEKQKKRTELADKKLTVDLANAERIYKTYFSTRLMAIIAATVSVILLLLKLAEAFGLLNLSKQ